MSNNRQPKNEKTPDIDIEKLAELEREYEALLNAFQLTFDHSPQSPLRNSDASDANRQKIVASMRNIELGVNLFSEEAEGLSPALRSRIFRLKIKIQTLNLYWMYNQNAALSHDGKIRRIIIDFLTIFVNKSPWFQCQDDMQCQRDLYTLYEILSRVEIKQEGFSTNQFLSTLIDKCGENFIKLMAFQALMVETMGMKRAGVSMATTNAVVGQQSGFEKTFERFQASAAQALSVQEKIELATGHFVAYRYHLACYQALRKKMPPVRAVRVERDRAGVQENFVIMPTFLPNEAFVDLERFMINERRLRTAHFQPAFERFDAITLDVLARDTRLGNLFISTIRNMFSQLLSMNHVFESVLKRCNQGETKFTATQIKAIAEYTEELLKAHTTWKNLYLRLVGHIKRGEVARPEYGGKTQVLEKLAGVLKETAAASVQVSSATTTVLEQYKAELTRMEKRANVVRAEFTSWAESQQKRFAAKQAKREEAKAASQGSSIPPRITIEEIEDDEPANVVVLADVKSDALVRLESHDKKLFEIIERLLRSTLKIKIILKLRQATSAFLLVDQLRSLDIALKASLTDFAALKAMQQRFETLQQSLPDDEKTKLSAGIAASIERAKQAEKDGGALLDEGAARLNLVDELVEQKREDTIKKFGVEKAVENGEDISELSAEDIWDRGMAEFIRRGRANRLKRADEQAEQKRKDTIKKSGVEKAAENGEDISKLSAEDIWNMGLAEFIRRGRATLSDEALERISVHACCEIYSSKLKAISPSNTEEPELPPQFRLSYPEPYQHIWAKLRGVPGNIYLFSDMVIDFVRTQCNDAGLPYCFSFASSCRRR